MHNLLSYTRACALLILLAGGSAAAAPCHADDSKKSESSASADDSTPKKVEGGLTERERMLLDRVELLERRVAELESKKAQPEKDSPAMANMSGNSSQPATGVSKSSPGIGLSSSNASFSNPSAANVEPANSSSAASHTQDAAVSTEKPKKEEPFAFADWTWLNGNSRTKESPLDTKYFTPEFRADTSYIYDFAHPQDHTLSGTSESGRTDEFQVQQLGVGGDFHVGNVRGRLMTQFGMYSTMTPRNDPTVGKGQWQLDNAYRYVSEAYGGYHINALHGINIDAGIFMSYIGLFSYYNFDNWAYQPSYVSSNTPWFFNGMRIQIFPTAKLKIEPWIINGWQSYGTANGRRGLGMQIAYRPNGKVAIISNNYGVGQDTVGVPGRTRWHTDDSIEVKYYDHPERFFDKSAFSLTIDAGCESGGGVTCFANSKGLPKQYFLGGMLYNRFWFHRDLFAVTLGGGFITNPGRYLVLLPPINGATSFSGTPYFTENPGDKFRGWDTSATFDYMPSQFITFRWEYDYRGSSVPYFAGKGGVTPPGGNSGAPGSTITDSNGNIIWFPDLRKSEHRMNMAILVKF
jgi:hypothetical protein